MLTFFRRLFKLALFLAVVAILFTGLMFWAKIWGVYCIPPSQEHPDGATLIVSREEDEPFLNASDRPVPQPPEEETQSQPRGMFGGGERKKPPIEKRTIVKFPFIKFIHEQAKK